MSCVNITNESVPGEPLKAGNGTVGTDEARITEIDWPIRKHVIVRAASDNTSTITVGPPGDAANGFVLAAGEQTPPMYVDDTSRVRVVGGDADQAFSWIGM
jgi:hypothetical protein